MADVPFQEAIDFVAGKVNLPTRKWDDLRHGAHVRAFSIAGVTRDDMLADFRAAIDKARRDGTGLKEFRRDFDAIVERTGWKFNARGSSEEARRAWRARIIYVTNMRTSYMAGRWQQMTDPDVLKYRPYWQYRHADGVKHPRLVHLSWDGKVWLATDPVWRVIYPPNGWLCHCDVVALSARQLARLGKTGPDPSPDLGAYQSTDPRTGQPETRYPDIDRGWEYNVGEEWQRGIVPTELREPLPPFGSPPGIAELPPMPAPRPAPAERLLPADREPEDYVRAFLSAFGLPGDGAGTWRDPSGGIVTVSRALFEARTPTGDVLGLKAGKRGRGQYALLLADAIRDPDEIWADWAQVKSGVVLRRSYLKRVQLPDGTRLLVRFEWTTKGWVGVTGFDTSEDYLAGMRRGALLYRRREE